MVYTNVFATPGGVGLGAWELKSRISYLSLNDVNKGVLTDYTVGCNWYWSERVRIMCDWIHPITTASTVFGATRHALAISASVTGTSQRARETDRSPAVMVSGLWLSISWRIPW